jgi:hypothetical protein
MTTEGVMRSAAASRLAGTSVLVTGVVVVVVINGGGKMSQPGNSSISRLKARAAKNLAFFIYNLWLKSCV